MSSRNGMFITFEGVEGAGKSTQCRLLGEALRQRGREVLETREPGGTPLGEELRGIIKHFAGDGGVCPPSELLLFAACRAQLVAQVVRPALHRGAVIICDRFADSTTVYQGFARGLDLDFIRRLHAFSVGECRPALTFVLDLPAGAGLDRAGRRSAGENGPVDRFESEKLHFHETVRNGFLRLAAEEPDRFRVVSGEQSPGEVHRRILEETLHALG